MEQHVTATDARVKFGSLLRRVVESGQPVVVDKAGTPIAVLLSIAEYRRLKRNQGPPKVMVALELARRARQQCKLELQGHQLPSPEEVLHDIRDWRGEELADLP